VLCGLGPREIDRLTLAEIMRLAKAWQRVNGKADDLMSADDFAAIAEEFPLSLNIVAEPHG
jgi:hypothetical protein